MTLHIHAPKGQYYAQTRRAGCRKWEQAGGPTRHKKVAALRATNALFDRNHKRARVLFCADWYDPVVVMEASV